MAATVLVLAGCGPEAYQGTKDAPKEFVPAPGAGDNSGGGGGTGDDGGNPTGAHPGAPANLTANGLDARVALAWEAPSDGGAPAEYHIHAADAEGVDTSGEPGAITTETAYEYTGLTNGVTYFFRVVAANGDGIGPASEEAGATPDVNANTAPVADAGPDQNVKTGDLVTMDGSASTDADGDPISYLWSFVSMPEGSAAALADATVVNPAFTADLDGAYVVQLTVNDGVADSTADFVTITATAVGTNATPTANAGADQNVTTGSQVTLDGSSSSDADLDTLAYLWSIVSLPTGSAAVLSDATVVNPAFTADIAGDYVVQLVVNDRNVDSTADFITITTSISNGFSYDFSQDPGFSTTDVTDYYWNESIGTYHFRSEDSENDYVYQIIQYNGESYTISVDIKMPEITWSGGLILGLLSDGMQYDATNGGLINFG
ncbi:MAG: fibronectin type III domain-containing protein, partial [SAR324 cluster bacterium]|nr:fibronectin type III domain-containing protein [SAR324 cluster bacterium]